MENKFEGLYIIGYGLGGGFGGQQYFDVIEAESLSKAEDEAFSMACDEYEGYVGMYGLRDIGQIMEEDECEEDEAVEIFEEERESWLDYSARPYSKEYEKEVMSRNYQNKFKHITG